MRNSVCVTDDSVRGSDYSVRRSEDFARNSAKSVRSSRKSLRVYGKSVRIFGNFGRVSADCEGPVANSARVCGQSEGADCLLRARRETVPALGCTLRGCGCTLRVSGYPLRPRRLINPNVGCTFRWIRLHLTRVPERDPDVAEHTWDASELDARSRLHAARCRLHAAKSGLHTGDWVRPTCPCPPGAGRTDLNPLPHGPPSTPEPSVFCNRRGVLLRCLSSPDYGWNLATTFSPLR